MIWGAGHKRDPLASLDQALKLVVMAEVTRLKMHFNLRSWTGDKEM